MRSRISKLSRPAQLIAAVGALVLALGGTATAASLITGAQIKDGTITGRDIKAGSIGASDLRGDAANALRGRGGIVGATGATGPRGDAGATGPKGDTGERGPQGPAGADGSDATQLGVLDAHGNRLGDYLSGVSTSGVAGSLTFLDRSDERVYTVDTGTGAYRPHPFAFVYETNNCSGPAYVQVAQVPSPQTVFARPGAESPGDLMYVAADTQQTITLRSMNGLGSCSDFSASPGPETVFAVQSIGTIPAAKPAPLRIG